MLRHESSRRSLFMITLLALGAPLGLGGCGGGGNTICSEDAACTAADAGDSGTSDAADDAGDAGDDAGDAGDDAGDGGDDAGDAGAFDAGMEGDAGMDSSLADAGADAFVSDGGDAGSDAGCVPVTFYADMDDDTWGDPATTLDACERPVGYVLRAEDCDDARSEVYPGGAEVCDGLDNDCNGAVDDGLTQGCGTDVGLCVAGTQTCAAGAWGSCAGEVTATAEVCDGALDENCDGTVDEGCACTSGDTRACGTDVGACVAGTQTCVGSAWAACVGATDASPEVCDGVDNDCDGTVDQGDPGGGASCGTDVGACVPGVMHCVAGTLSCEGSTDPATEVCDGVDNDCDGSVDEALTELYYLDSDMDGHGDMADPGVMACGAPSGRVASHDDCDDGNAAVLPGGTEVCDGLDNDCNGVADEGLTQSCGSDVGACVAGMQVCDLGAWGSCFGEVTATFEMCDGLLDENCDGTVDEGCTCTSGDSRSCGTDVGACVAGTQRCTSGAWEPCFAATDPTPEVCDGLDNDCDGTVDEGDPGGGVSCGTDVGACVAGVQHCTAGAPVCEGQTAPATEVCDGVDNNCDGSVDEGVTTLYYLDADMDGHGDMADPGVAACSAPSGRVASHDDCNDGSALALPGGTEVCDGLDNDCNGSVDDALARSCGSDIGVCVAGTQTCAVGAWGSCAGEVTPTAEVCDGALDENCDGTVDEGCACTDGAVRGCGTDVGACVAGTQTCVGGAWAACAGATDGSAEVCDGLDNDCDGTVDNGDPGAGATCGTAVGACVTGVIHCVAGALSCQGATVAITEVCDGVDNDCDGSVDEGDPGGGASCGNDVGACVAGVLHCTAGALRCEGGTSGTAEVCDGVDNDCDGSVDEGLTQSCGTDVGVCVAGTQTCAAGTWGTCSGEVASTLEVCDGLDNDCDGASDEGLSPPACAEQRGVCAGSVKTCGSALGWLTCNSSRYGPNYSATEICDGLDNNCDGSVDEGTLIRSYPDVDGDSFGDASDPGVLDCVVAAGFVTDHTDCDDAHAAAKPGGTEICDGLDNDCDGTTDGAVATAWCNDPAQALPNATSTCTGGACAILSCTAPFASCDSDATNGCEANLNSDAANCGTCGHACALGAGSCSARSCDDAVQIAAGWYHACLLRASGVIDCWGNNGSGQLGDGTTLNRNTMTRVVGITNAVSIAAGGLRTCAVLANGRAKCWGDNAWGGVGDGTRIDRSTPTRVSGLTQVTRIATSLSHTCARVVGGDLWCWGSSVAGLGDGTSAQSSTPVRVVASAIGPAHGVTVGRDYTCALSAGKDVYCWGLNSRGQLGDGTTTSRSTPVRITAPAADYVQVRAGSLHACAHRAGGGTKCWGANDSGELGDGTVVERHRPTTVPGLSAAELDTTTSHSCALEAGGVLQCWGKGTSGQLGYGGSANQTSPVSVLGISTAVAVAAGSGFTCALLADGRVRCWGSDSSGQLGDGPGTSSTQPLSYVIP